MPIIDNTFFKYDLAIPNAIAQPTVIPNSPVPANVAALNDCIKYVEEELLLNALGVTIYNELKTALADLPNADQKWKDLVNGKEYDEKKWIGLKAEKSLLCYAVYYAFLDYNSTFWTTLGIEKPQAENSQNIVPDFKLAASYQTFLKKYQGGACIKPYRITTGSFTFTDYYGSESDVYVSLYQYLRDNKDVYGWEDSLFAIYEQKNSFGL